MILEPTLEFARLGSGAGHRRGHQMEDPDPEDQPDLVQIRVPEDVHPTFKDRESSSSL